MRQVVLAALDRERSPIAAGLAGPGLAAALRLSRRASPGGALPFGSDRCAPFRRQCSLGAARVRRSRSHSCTPRARAGGASRCGGGPRRGRFRFPGRCRARGRSASRSKRTASTDIAQLRCATVLGVACPRSVERVASAFGIAPAKRGERARRRHLPGAGYPWLVDLSRRSARSPLSSLRSGRRWRERHRRLRRSGRWRRVQGQGQLPAPPCLIERSPHRASEPCALACGGAITRLPTAHELLVSNAISLYSGFAPPTSNRRRRRALRCVGRGLGRVGRFARALSLLIRPARARAKGRSVPCGGRS